MFPDFLSGSLSMHLYEAIFTLPESGFCCHFPMKKRKLIMVGMNTTKAKETTKRIRGIRQEKRLQSFNLLPGALRKGDKKRVTIYKLYGTLKGGFGEPRPGSGLNESSQDLGFQKNHPRGRAG